MVPRSLLVEPQEADDFIQDLIAPNRIRFQDAVGHLIVAEPVVPDTQVLDIKPLIRIQKITPRVQIEFRHL